MYFLSAVCLSRFEVTLHKPLPKAPYTNAYRRANIFLRLNRHTCCLSLILLYYISWNMSIKYNKKTSDITKSFAISLIFHTVNFPYSLCCFYFFYFIISAFHYCITEHIHIRIIRIHPCIITDI